MNDTKIDESFWNRADSFINLANELCENAPRGKVSSSLLYAAARYNSFVVAASAKTANEMKNQKDSAIKYFVEQYKKMLEENLDDHINNFERYIEKRDS